MLCASGDASSQLMYCGPCGTSFTDVFLVPPKQIGLICGFLQHFHIPSPFGGWALTAAKTFVFQKVYLGPPENSFSGISYARTR